jgi:hypothetical protein
VAQLIDELPVPAFVQGRWMDVLIANPIAQALSPHYRKGANVLRAVFLDPDDRVLHQDLATCDTGGGFRAAGSPSQAALRRLASVSPRPA